MAKYKTVLITGASSGIGRALAELYAAPGMTLLLAGRDPARIEAAAQACRARGAVAEVSTVPVTDREVFESLVRAWDDAHEIDLVIANAGISGGMGRLGGEDDAQFRAIMDTNLGGLFNTVNPLIPRMKARGRGQVALMGSLAGFRGMPGAPAYSVSKNAVRAYAEALRPQLAPFGVKVSVICPGFIRTPLTDVNTFPMPFLMDAEEAALRMKKGLDADRAVIAFPLPMFLFVKFLSLLPRCLGDWVMGKAPKKP